MTILGLSGGFRQGYQDVSACLIRDGKVIAAIEEERLNRIKFSAGRLPYLSVIEVLKIAGITIQQVDALAFHGSTWEPEIDGRIADYFVNHFGYAPPLKRFHHHDCHAAGSFFSSGFNDALIVTMDNSGDGVSVQIAVGKGEALTEVKRFHRPNSLGVFYSLITQYCGFVKDSDEYKLMGLAAYGDSSRYKFDWLLQFENGGLVLDTDYIVTVPPKAPSLHRDEMNFNDKFLAKMGAPRRTPGEAISRFYKDVAASAQRHLEDTVLQMIEYYTKQTGLRRLCLAGGVSLNCLMNQRLMNAPFVDEIFIQPASSDAGIAMGSAWLACLEKNVKPHAPTDAFLGNEYTDEYIRELLENCGVDYEQCGDVAVKAAELIADNKVVAWFQGRMEFGPRALGNRSILANPAAPNIQSIVNRKIKFRDSFRPFGASVLEEDVSSLFEGKQGIAPYMTVTYGVKTHYCEALAGVTHADGTCRIQSVNQKQNALYYSLLKQLKAKTGVGACLNTSFNLNYEPIVCTPQNALATFFASGIDALVIGGFLVKKG